MFCSGGQNDGLVYIEKYDLVYGQNFRNVVALYVCIVYC